jgi:hypothetical protein
LQNGTFFKKIGEENGLALPREGVEGSSRRCNNGWLLLSNQRLARIREGARKFTLWIFAGVLKVV